ncbi:MAG: tRNA uridine-5-carboxymethylaminomethyl(34) synthesis GTPase MnmE [Gammaproteobacteria bacterium]|nr:tRNA uridine-5-carboxymethylaminomethyl(34) synthesis GTPase MnmE [Gammaproteobacteria bacterium]MBT8110732.1 tRNA uridine-5-carboxymethylaminomethyl(34) synthesis GTPase MnmE [Gammaproteobacteria bacterium]NNL45431.1 tRNA uridine-5-carboxymethylaminomethyl(34) synthesis GTPase MnmE [Woeseiaceae bacterium]
MASRADTIVASATPPGIGGIGVVRVSGDEAERIARAMLGSLPEPRTATYRSFADARGQKIDAGIALFFPRPTSFTGESVLELHGHGGPIVMSLLVDAAIALGARQAAPGEFSERAFLNDKLDLVQAEAIVDLIGSGTAQAARAAVRSLSGAFSKAVNGLAEKLTQLRMHVEAAIDFPEEEIDFLSDEKLLLRLQDCASTFDALIDATRQGRVLRDGYRVVIVGKPNAGKSSLMNLLSGQEAAIVTEVAGTTRDILREQIDIEGLAVELVDTAGLRDDPDRIEAEGIRRARIAVESADAVLWIQDASDPDRGGIVEELPETTPVIVVRNKIDLTNEAAGAGSENTIRLSAKTGDGVDVLREAIRGLAGYENRGEGAFTARRRHLDALARAKAHFLSGRQALLEARAGELLAEELRLCQQALGEITGAITSDELLGKIFSEFCIGK